MRRTHEILSSLADTDVSIESYDRRGQRIAQLDGEGLLRRIAYWRPRVRALGPETGERRLLALLFRSEETIEFFVVAFAAMAEGVTVVPLYPTWTVETQLLYLRRYGLRRLAVGPGYRQRASEWGEHLDHVLEVSLDQPEEEAAGGEMADGGVEAFPEHLPPSQPAAWIFTSGTSGDLAKCTEITLGNLEAAAEGIRQVDFLREGLVVHSPLSASHIFAFAVAFGLMGVRPRRVLFSDVQYLTRLPEAVTGKVDVLILVPLVVNRLRVAFYERLGYRARPGRKTPPDLRSIARVPRPLRRLLLRGLRLAEESVIRLEQGRWSGWLGWPVVRLLGGLFGRSVRPRLGSPDYVVLGGAKPGLAGMAFLEVMGIRAIQGWGMTETTGPLACCRAYDRRRGAFGTCGPLFPEATAEILETGELVVRGPQIATGYVHPDGTLDPFEGSKATGDSGAIDPRGRLRILGKASDRITCENGLNYNPVPMEESLKARDLDRENLLDDIVVIGDGQPRLGAVFFLRESQERDEGVEGYVDGIVHTHNGSRPVDEKLGTWAISDRSLRDVGGLGPSGKLIRRRVEEAFAHIFEEQRERRS